jgi:hypothetical protein
MYVCRNRLADLRVDDSRISALDARTFSPPTKVVESCRSEKYVYLRHPPRQDLPSQDAYQMQLLLSSLLVFLLFMFASCPMMTFWSASAWYGKLFTA